MGFQLPALVFEGITVVVSPLKALMQNQVEDLQAKGIKAEYINSSMAAAERNRVHKDLDSLRPVTKLLYVTPELLSTVWIERLKSLYARGLLSSIVIDEAHTVSIWGHDFRSAYLQLGRLKELFPNTPMMACTATATSKVQADIVSVLRMEAPRKFTASFNRPNISYEVRYKDLVGNVFEDIVKLVKSFIENGQPSGIVYCHKREDCDFIATALREHGIKGAAYHAGLNDTIRSTTLTDWVSKKIDTVVATIAFGMGIDNPNVRYVIHFTIPQTLEDFYQESGRAGRDGEPSVSILYACREDISLRAHFLNKSFSEESSHHNNKNKFGSSSSKNSETKGFTPEQLIQRKRNALEKMADFCNKPGCRRRALLAYFGEDIPLKDVPKVCKATCDYCQNPGLVSKQIQDSNDRSALSSGFSRKTYDPDAAQPDLSEPPPYDPMADEDDNGKKNSKRGGTIHPAIWGPPPGTNLDEWRAQLSREEAEENEREEKRKKAASSSTSYRRKSFKIFADEPNSDEEEGGRRKKPWMQPQPQNYLQSFASPKGRSSAAPSKSPSALSKPFVPPRSINSTSPSSTSSPTSATSQSPQKVVVKQSAASPQVIPAASSDASPVRLNGGIKIMAKPSGGASLLAGTILDPNFGKKRAPSGDIASQAPLSKQPKLTSSTAPSSIIL